MGPPLPQPLYNSKRLLRVGRQKEAPSNAVGAVSRGRGTFSALAPAEVALSRALAQLTETWHIGYDEVPWGEVEMYFRREAINMVMQEFVCGQDA